MMEGVNKVEVSIMATSGNMARAPAALNEPKQMTGSGRAGADVGRGWRTGQPCSVQADGQANATSA